jgi:hypothetical protein
LYFDLIKLYKPASKSTESYIQTLTKYRVYLTKNIETTAWAFGCASDLKNGKIPFKSIGLYLLIGANSNRVKDKFLKEYTLACLNLKISKRRIKNSIVESYNRIKLDIKKEKDYRFSIK